MFESPSSATTATIEAVRLELKRFQKHRRDASVRYHCSAIDTYLAARLVGRDDPWLRKTLASKVEKLAEAVRNAKFSSPIANDVESASSVTSVMIETSDVSFADTPAGVA